MEARCLFNASAQQMEALIHPQSVIHSMVRYQDGSVLAQLGGAGYAYADRPYHGLAGSDHGIPALNRWTSVS
ncbi:hypothetical protein MJ390_05885 [Klebsiella pneumoniae]|nr:hypothetical protein MJ390_05885 [Klebsiella pneumoniae]